MAEIPSNGVAGIPPRKRCYSCAPNCADLKTEPPMIWMLKDEDSAHVGVTQCVCALVPLRLGSPDVQSYFAEIPGERPIATDGLSE